MIPINKLSIRILHALVEGLKSFQITEIMHLPNTEFSSARLHQRNMCDMNISSTLNCSHFKAGYDSEHLKLGRCSEMDF